MSEYAVETPDEIADDLELLDAIRTWDPISAIDKAPSVDAAAALCAAVQSARAALGLAEDELARFVNDVLPYNSTLIVEGKPFAVKAGSQRTAWEHDDLKRTVATEIAERTSLAQVNVATVLSAWTACCGFSWKVTGLRGLGIDPDEYCRKTIGPPKLVPL